MTHHQALPLHLHLKNTPKGAVITPFRVEGNGDSERLGALSRATQLLCGRRAASAPSAAILSPFPSVKGSVGGHTWVGQHQPP